MTEPQSKDEIKLYNKPGFSVWKVVGILVLVLYLFAFVISVTNRMMLEPLKPFQGLTCEERFAVHDKIFKIPGSITECIAICKHTGHFVACRYKWCVSLFAAIAVFSGAPVVGASFAAKLTLI